MNRVMSGVLVLMLLGGFYGLYSLSLKVRQVQKEIELLESNTRAEREAIRVLEAEWAYLNRPEYIQTVLAQLDLVPVVASQYAAFDILPYTIPPEIPQSEWTGADRPIPHPKRGQSQVASPLGIGGE